MKRIILIVGVVVVAGAFLAGYWPQHRRAIDAEGAMNAARLELSDANRKVRLSELLGRLLRLSDAVEARNFGEAAALSTAYFDRVRTEAVEDARPEVKQALEQILQTRDDITTALTRTDPAVAVTLRQQQITLRRALGYPVPPA